jgi:hypothetical protein
MTGASAMLNAWVLYTGNQIWNIGGEGEKSTLAE